MDQTGRPSKYNEETVRAILDAIQYGCTKTEAAAVVNINRDTVNNWEHEYPEFAEAIKIAEQKQIAFLVKSISESKDWRAAAWLLERRHPDRFSLNVQFKTKEPAKYEFTGERAEAVLDLARSLLKESGDQAKDENASSSDTLAS
jgi:DNA-binding XRE family transcriptional regulator